MCSRIVLILTDDQLMYERDELYLFGSQYDIQLAAILILIGQTLQMSVSIEERLITKHVFEVDSQCLNPVPLGVAGGDTGNVFQETRVGSLVFRLLEDLIIGIILGLLLAGVAVLGTRGHFYLLFKIVVVLLGSFRVLGRVEALV